MKGGRAALAGASLFCFATPAFAGDGWYLGLGGGSSQLQDFGFVDQDIEFDSRAKNAFRADIAGGLKTLDGLRIEFEGAWAHNAVNCCGFLAERSGGSGAGGWVNVGTAMINGAYDIPIAPAIALTLGIGIGAGSVTGRVHAFDIDTGEITDFAYQVIAGLVWSITPDLDLQVDYRWLSIADNNDPINRNGVNSNNVMLNLRWYLEPRLEIPVVVSSFPF